MSRSPQLYPEEQGIFVAIPPPLVPPLARQLSSSHHQQQHHGIINPQQLATPTTSTDNSFEQWTSFEPLLLQQHLLQQQQQQQQQALALLGGDRGSPRFTSTGGLSGSSNAGGQNRGLPPVPARSGSRTTLDSNTSNASNTNIINNTTNNSNATTNRASAEGRGIIPLNTPVSSPQQPPLPLSFPVQLLNRLYPFSAMSTTSAGSGGGINPSMTIESSSCASSSSAGSYHSRNLMSGMGIGSGFGSRSASSLMQQQPDMLARRNSTELARTAAATAIVNTLVNRGNNISGGGNGSSEVVVGLSIPRGDSPYIPSSLSMLFSDPEIMQGQSEVDQHNQQILLQQQQERRMSSSQLPLSHSGSGVGSGIFANSEDGDQESSNYLTEDHQDDDHVYGEESRLLQGTIPLGTDRPHTATTGTAGREGDDGGYGYEIVQEDQQEDVFRPYVAMMVRDDYLAPHEPSSSSPLFPSPLTTLGGYASGTSMLDVAEDQQAQAAGRIWRDYGTMMENGGGQGQYRYPLQLQNPTPSQSHAAYYHAVSNYHYSYNSNPHDDAGGGGGGSSSSTSQVNPCVPTGHYAVPESWQWRRQHGRGVSHQSYGSAGGNGSSGSGARRNNGDGSDDHWLWGILVSVVGCWVCCESPAACCTNCCL